MGVFMQMEKRQKNVKQAKSFLYVILLVHNQETDFLNKSLITDLMVEVLNLLRIKLKPQSFVKIKANLLFVLH